MSLVKAPKITCINSSCAKAKNKPVIIVPTWNTYGWIDKIIKDSTKKIRAGQKFKMLEIKARQCLCLNCGIVFATDIKTEIVEGKTNRADRKDLANFSSSKNGQLEASKQVKGQKKSKRF